MKERGISRRNFIKGIGGVAAAASVLSGLKSKSIAQELPTFVTLPKDKLLEMYRRMQRIRQGEEKIREMMTTGRVYEITPTLAAISHTSAGEEATCVGVAMAMEKGDMLTGSHRSHGYPLAMGLDLNRWMAEFFNKVTGTNRGHGGSMHIAAPELGILGMSGQVGGAVSHPIGAAKAFKLRGSKQVAISTFGDGAMNTAGFGASFNLAGIWNVPVVFVCNNNQWTINIPTRLSQKLVQAGKDLSVRATGFGIPGYTVDGNDVFGVYKATKYCLDQARAGKGPSFIECVTYRRWQHSGPLDHEVLSWPYNNPAELEYWLRRDPIKRFENFVLSGLLSDAELESIRKEVGTELEKAVEFAVNSPFPDPEEEFKYFRDVFGA